MRSVVVLPQPEGPRSAKNWPCSIVSEIPSTATTPSKSFVTFSRRMSAGRWVASGSIVGCTVLAKELAHRLPEDLAVLVDVCCGRPRRDQRHVVERRQEHAAVEREDVHVAVELGIDRCR